LDTSRNDELGRLSRAFQRMASEVQQREVALRQALPDDAADTVWKNIAGPVNRLVNERSGKLVPRLLGLGLALWAALLHAHPHLVGPAPAAYLG